MTKYYIAGEGALWAQPDGPNTKPQFLGCHTLGDITVPRGALNLMYCKDPSKPKAYQVVGSYRSAPGAITTSITTLLSEVADYLERWDCSGPIFAHKVSCGRMDVFDVYDRSFVFKDAEVTSRGLSGMASRTPDDETETLQSFDIEAQDSFDAFDLKAVRQSTTSLQPLNDVHFCGDERCEGDCGEAQRKCELGYAVGDGIAGSPAGIADVLETLDGATWAVTDDEPFAVGEDIAVVTCFAIGSGIKRVLVGRGTTDALNPAEIAYSDDGGDTWTNVDVGTTDGQFFTGPDAIFALDMYHIWAVTSGGYIYFSEDGGATWVAQEEGVITAGDWNGVHFADEDFGFVIGDTDVIASSTDGGTNWAAVTATGPGDNLLSIRCLSEFRAWVGTDGGELYYTHDAGTTWNARAFSDSGAGTVPSIDFINPYVGAFVYNYLHLAVTYGRVYYTINGGYSWRQVTVPTNMGLNSIFVCEPYLMYAVGEIQGTTPVILKIHD